MNYSIEKSLRVTGRVAPSASIPGHPMKKHTTIALLIALVVALLLLGLLPWRDQMGTGDARVLEPFAHDRTNTLKPSAPHRAAKRNHTIQRNQDEAGSSWEERELESARGPQAPSPLNAFAETPSFSGKIYYIRSREILPRENPDIRELEALQEAIHRVVGDFPSEIFLFDLDAEATSGQPVFLYTNPEYDLTSKVAAEFAMIPVTPPVSGQPAPPE